MDEITQVIVLAAGSSRRMGDLARDKPKCLLPYKDELILVRLIRQLNENGIKKIVLTVGFKKERVKACIEELKNSSAEIVIVENDKYEEDVNIYSMKLALEQISGPFVVFEADTLMEDALVKYVVGSDFDGKSVWFTNGPFNQSQYGGILRSNMYGLIKDIKIVPAYDDIFAEYSKLTGLMRVGPNEVESFKRLVTEYAKKTIKQYYLMPWIENLQDLNCIEGNVEHYVFKTFNTPKEYQDILGLDFDTNKSGEKTIEFIEPEKLKSIEHFSEDRLNLLVDKIKNEGVWTKPLYVEKNHNLVLDGHHRLQAALRLGLKYVPIQGFEYKDVKVWTLRKEEFFDVPTVIKRSNKGTIYPYKTIKHKFPSVIGSCEIPLEHLKNKERGEGMNNKRLIVLAAGQGFKLEGFNKLLIRDPRTAETILERYKRLFPKYEITVVVGYRAISLMSRFPDFNYVYNDQWRVTGSSYSLSLVLDERPSVILSSDFFFDEEMVELIENSPPNSVFIHYSENKTMNTSRCTTQNSKITSIYLGETHNHDPELTGIYKISDPSILRKWKIACCNNKNALAPVNLPVTSEDVFAVDTKDLFFHDINSPLDYLNLLNYIKNSK